MFEEYLQDASAFSKMQKKQQIQELHVDTTVLLFSILLARWKLL